MKFFDSDKDFGFTKAGFELPSLQELIDRCYEIKNVIK
jgi:hypothetical protein